MIRRDFHAHLLRALLATLLHLVDKTGDVQGVIELKHDAHGPPAGPAHVALDQRKRMAGAGSVR